MTVLALLCKWNKQRYKRHIVKLSVSAKNLGYGRPSTSGGELWGEQLLLFGVCTDIRYGVKIKI
jgi:hypothetical protein